VKILNLTEEPINQTESKMTAKQEIAELRNENAELRNEIAEIRSLLIGKAITPETKPQPRNLKRPNIKALIPQKLKYENVSPHIQTIREITTKLLTRIPEIKNFSVEDIEAFINTIDKNPFTKQIDGRSLSAGVRELRRITAMNVLNNKEIIRGRFQVSEIAEALGTCTVTLGKWRKMAETGSLTERKRGAYSPNGKKKGRKPKQVAEPQVAA
jgi:transposase-like protein